MSSRLRGPSARAVRIGAILAVFGAAVASAQVKHYPWNGYGNDAQHTGISLNVSQDISRVAWSTPVDLYPPYSGDELFIHYGSPLCSPSNNIVIPVKTGYSDGFRVDMRRGFDGTLKWSMNTDYRLPPHNWYPSFGATLAAPNNMLYMPAAGGTVLYRKGVDGATGETGRVAFFGSSNYAADPSAYDNNVYINTPITADPLGTIYFGFWATGDTPLHLVSGIARITRAGVGTWTSAATASADPNITKVVTNCAPALSNDGQTLYFGVHSGSWTGGYLVAVDAKTLKPKNRAPLMDALQPGQWAHLVDDGTSSPTVGPDGDVYYGVLEANLGQNHYRGWLLHFDANLQTQKPTGAFGWDDTAAIVPSSAVPSYAGSSSYLLFSKYNNYAGVGGDGVNKIAILDPNATMTDPQTGATVMKEILTVPAPTPDDKGSDYPNAVREWCINSAAVDPARQCVFANNEDGKLYRWNLVTNKLDQVVTLTSGIGEAYTPTIVGTDGRVYAINNATLFCVAPKRASAP